MAAQRSSPRKDEKQASTPAPAAVAPPSSAPAEQTDADLHRLGATLRTRTGEILAVTVDRTVGSGQVVDALVQDSFERICKIATVAVARWMAGEGLDVTREAGKETWYIFGQLAAHRGASLKEVARRCLIWRDCVAEVLRENATQLETSPDALAQALAMLQLSLDVTLVGICECFETERKRTDAELELRQ